MQALVAKTRNYLANLSLRAAIGLALLVGLSIPVAISVWGDLTARRSAEEADLANDHAMLGEVLSIGMQTAIWEVRPDLGRPMIEAVMRDERVTSIDVTTPFQDPFLAAAVPSRRTGDALVLERAVMRGGERIGTVKLEMNSGHLDREVVQQWTGSLGIGLLQLAMGMLIILPLLRFKVLAPLDRLLQQSAALGQGRLDDPLLWRRTDELGRLGSGFESMRRALQQLFGDLAHRNRELQAREAALERSSSVLRTTLDNMTDGITLVSESLNLVAWNRRFEELLSIEPGQLHEGICVDDIVSERLHRQSDNAGATQELLQTVRRSFRPEQPSSLRLCTARGRVLDIRRQPMPSGGYVSTYTDVTDEVKARRHADETLELLKAVMDAMPAVIHVKDSDMRMRMINRHFRHVWQVREATAIGKRAAEIFPRDRARDDELQDQLILESRSEQPFREVVMNLGDGREINAWSTKVPLLGDNGVVTHIVTVDIDVSERRRAESERQRWLQLFNDALESIPHGFAVYDIKGCLVICNTAYAELYGVTATELVGGQIQQLTVPALQRMRTLGGRAVTATDTWAQGQLERLWRGDSEPIEAELVDGRWVLLSRYPTSEGGFVYVRSDVSELRRIQHELVLSEERFRCIAEAHPVPVVITRSADGRIVYANPAACRLWGLTSRQMLGTFLEDYVADPRQRSEIERLREECDLELHELQLRRADSAIVPAAITSRPIAYDGEAAIVSGVFDLTELKAAEREIARHREALHQSEKLNALGTLLAGVAHELNNPLSVVVGQALMLGEAAKDQATRHRAEKIGAAADRCARIIRTFLSMARQSAPQRVDVDLNDVVEAALEITGYPLRSAGIDVACELAPRLPPVIGDPDQLTQVVMNLLINAEQALAERAPPREVRLVTRFNKKNQQVTVSVSDNGPGIPDDIRARIFEPFYTTKDTGMGTGVGLSVCLGIVQTHGGRLDVESAVARGATFSVKLPAALPVRGTSVVPQDREQGALEPSSSKKILIVDDEPDVLDMLNEILVAEGHQIFTARSGREALERLSDMPCDAVLTDLRMPDLDGPAFYREITTRFPDLAARTAFITGDALGTSTRKFFESDQLPYLEKPFSPNEVVDLIARLTSD